MLGHRSQGIALHYVCNNQLFILVTGVLNGLFVKAGEESFLQPLPNCSATVVKALSAGPSDADKCWGPLPSMFDIGSCMLRQRHVARPGKPGTRLGLGGLTVSTLPFLSRLPRLLRCIQLQPHPLPRRLA